MKYRLLFLIPLVVALLQGCVTSKKNSDDDTTKASIRLLNLPSTTSPPRPAAPR